jgi:hypothetical protein
VSLILGQSVSELHLQVQNDGDTVRIVFNPEMPFGTKLRGARVGDHAIAATLEEHRQRSHARLEFDLPHGSKSLTVFL